jgi:hypothetical protein
VELLACQYQLVANQMAHIIQVQVVMEEAVASDRICQQVVDMEQIETTNTQAA